MSNLSWKEIIAIAVGALIFLFGIYWLGSFVRADIRRRKPKPLPNSGQGLPAGFDGHDLARRLAAALPAWGYDVPILQELLNLATDDMFVVVGNTFYDFYGNGKTLREALDAEWELAWGDPSLKVRLYDRLGRLGF